MTLRYTGGVIRAAAPTVTSSSAKGVWLISQILPYRSAGTWPVSTVTVVQTFLATGTWTAPTGVTEVQYLVVAGGAGGGRVVAGGGGAGGFRTGTGLSVTAGTDYTITVGAGGPGSANRNQAASVQNGSNSVFSTITATGGGGGGNVTSGATFQPGESGGSGGGGSGGVSGGNGNTPSTSPSQGNGIVFMFFFSFIRNGT